MMRTIISFYESVDLIDDQWKIKNQIDIDLETLKQRDERKEDCIEFHLAKAQSDIKGIIFIKVKESDRTQPDKLALMKRLQGRLQGWQKQLYLDLTCLDSSWTQEKKSILVEKFCVALYMMIDTQDLYKTKDTKEKLNFLISTAEEESYAKSIERAQRKADTINRVRRLVNSPSNHKRPEHMEQWMRETEEKSDMSLKVLEKVDLEELGFHALLAVNRGSEYPAKCLVGEYRQGKQDGPHVVLVGKGVTFDTGGISIKGHKHMHHMKSDMGGAAAVMGALDLVAKEKLPIDLTVIIPTTDNAVDSKSIYPGDVIQSYSGKTIEVINTDAEGRLILADGLAYALDRYQPDYLIDLATLTGSAVYSLGTETAAMFSSDENMAAEFSQVGETWGERVWRLPLWPDYRRYMDSDIADISNLSNRPMAGAITAAKFLEYFTEEHPRWLHLDVAGVSFHNLPGMSYQAATGYGVELLFHWLENLCRPE